MIRRQHVFLRRWQELSGCKNTWFDGEVAAFDCKADLFFEPRRNVSSFRSRSYFYLISQTYPLQTKRFRLFFETILTLWLSNQSELFCLISIGYFQPTNQSSLFLTNQNSFLFKSVRFTYSSFWRFPLKNVRWKALGKMNLLLQAIFKFCTTKRLFKFHLVYSFPQWFLHNLFLN